MFDAPLQKLKISKLGIRPYGSEEFFFVFIGEKIKLYHLIM